MRTRNLTLAALILAATATAALAQEPDYAAARRHYTNGVEAEKKGDYETAATEYAAAYNITKDPVLFYRIGRAYEQAGNIDAAIVYYRRYVNEAKDAKDIEQVKAHIAELEGTAGDGGDGTPPPDRDGTPPPDGDGGDGIVPPDGDGGDGIVPPDGGDGTQPPTFMDEGSRWERKAAWVSVGVAAAFLTTGALMAASANSRQEDIDILVDSRDPQGRPLEYTVIQDDYEDARDEGEKFEKYALFSFAGAGVAAIAAGVFFYLDATRDDGAPPRATAVAPVITPDLVGFSATWGF